MTPELPRPAMLTLMLAMWFGCANTSRPPNIAETDVDLRLPPAERFTFGPGDAMKIWVWRHEDLTVDVTIAPDGMISYPLVGRIEAAGLTYEELISVLQTKVAEYYVDAQVSVNITSVTNQKVFVLGEVNSPGVLQITSEMSMLEALIKTGGFNQDARTKNVLLVRGGLEKPTLYTVNVDAIYGQGDMSQMVYLQKGDIIVVPTKTITNVERFFRHVQAILAPAVGASAIYRNVLGGGAQGTSSSLGE